MGRLAERPPPKERVCRVLAFLSQVILFVAALSALIVIVATVRRYGHVALELKVQLDSCAGARELRWSIVEHGAVRPTVQHRVTQSGRLAPPLRPAVLRAAA